MQESNRTSTTGANKSKKYIFMTVVLVVVIIALTACIIVYFSKDKQTDEKETVRSVFVDEKNVEETKEKLKEPVEDGYFKTKMSIDWNFENGTAVSKDAYVANAEDNTRMMYFDVNLQDTKQLVYSSPYLPLGTELKEIKLEENLSAGDYEAVVTYHLVDDAKEEISKVSVAIKLHILN